MQHTFYFVFRPAGTTCKIDFLTRPSKHILSIGHVSTTAISVEAKSVLIESQSQRKNTFRLPQWGVQTLGAF